MASCPRHNQQLILFFTLSPLTLSQPLHKLGQIIFRSQQKMQAPHKPSSSSVRATPSRVAARQSARHVLGRRPLLVRADAAAGGDKVVCVGEALFGECVLQYSAE